MKGGDPKSFGVDGGEICAFLDGGGVVNGCCAFLREACDEGVAGDVECLDATGLGGDVGECGDAKGFCVEDKVGQEGRVCRDGGCVKGGDGGAVEDGDAEGFGGTGGSTFVVGGTGDIGDSELGIGNM